MQPLVDLVELVRLKLALELFEFERMNLEAMCSGLDKQLPMIEREAVPQQIYERIIAATCSYCETLAFECLFERLLDSD